MRRVPLLELAIEIAAEPHGALYTWTLRAWDVYPARPARDQEWRTLAVHHTQGDGGEPAPMAGAIRRRLLLDRMTRVFIDRLVVERRRGDWARVAITATGAWGDWPWEAVFARFGLVVVRRERFAAREARELAFPLRIGVIRGPGPTFRRRGFVLRDPVVARAAQAGAIDASVSDGDLDVAVILGRYDEAIVQAIAATRPRLIVVLPHVGRGLRPLGATLMAATGAAAVLQIHRRPSSVIRGVVGDRPLDVIVGDQVAGRHAVLHCVDGGETCVSLSRVVGAALQLDERVEVHGAVDPDDALAAEWARTLARPLETADARAQALEIEDAVTQLRGGGDLGRAVGLAHEARTLVAEQPAVMSLLGGIAARGTFDKASTRIMLVDICAPNGEPLPPASLLAVGASHELRVQIARHRTAAWVSELVPASALRATLAGLDTIQLTVVAYANMDRVELEPHRGTLLLSQVGTAPPIALRMRVLVPGTFALRVCIFHGNALLQSVIVEGTAGVDPDEVRPLAARLDYAASSHLMLLDRHAQPDATIWANATSDGTHWIGVYASGGCLPVARELATFTTEDLQTIARGLQTALSAVQLVSTEPPQYRFATLDAPAGATQLARLAREGWKAYTALFGRPQEDSPAAATREGLLAIALCRPERTNLAWAALYDYYLDGEDHALCDVFRTERVLGDSATCRARFDCPLQDPERAKRTVCPFGFWGIRHRIEQPLSHVALDDAETRDVSYDELQHAARLGSSITCGTSGEPRIVIAAWPGFQERMKKHLDEVAALAPQSRCESDREVVLKLLAEGGNHIYYFFCHGVGERMDFKLRVHGDIAVSDLNNRRFMWSAPGPAPLVFLNGCDTAAFRSERINKLLERLRAMGASGVIGTEIPVHTSLASDVGRRLLHTLVDGTSLGDAFLTMRRALLREHLNPLGLAYTFFASARLHLCPTEACTACASTPVASSSSSRRTS